MSKNHTGSFPDPTPDGKGTPLPTPYPLACCHHTVMMSICGVFRNMKWGWGTFQMYIFKSVQNKFFFSH